MQAIGRVCYKMKGVNVTCDDGVSRAAYLRSYWDGQRWASYGDTYFTVPAFVRVKGRVVRGYVTSEGEKTHFHATKTGKHADLIVPTTSKE